MGQHILEDPLLSLVCGGAAGALSRTAVSPFERVKVLFQVQGKSGYNNGTMATVVQLYKEEGWRGMFRGNGVNCVRIVPYTAIQYAVYERIKLFVGGEMTPLVKIGAGLIAGTASVLGTYPLDLVKTRLSVLTAQKLDIKNTKASLTLHGTLMNIYHNEGGILALYRGIVPTVLGVAPYVAINFALFEYLSERVQENINKKPSTLVVLLLGAFSGGVAQTMAYPFDMLRRRFQIATIPSSPFKYKSTIDALQQIVRRDGLKGLYRGWGANMWKIMPSMAVQWASYDFLKKVL